MVNSEIIELLMEEQKKRGITNARLAKMLGVSPSLISKYWHSQREMPLEIVFKITDVLKIDKINILEMTEVIREEDDICLVKKETKQLAENLDGDRLELLQAVEGCPKDVVRSVITIMNNCKEKSKFEPFKELP